ncbi:uncharacterized protein HKW66_Vig0082170 [Vigna angularis]|uniref:PB1-like domain-containing protein n=1 Tax=Phaseolus angularis TaxID=3914 RepID=A0A8T0KIH9_PHAAN|nr:uncharacterized protein HKW66_Vig0082170 [Vigna angularis]
MWPCFLECGVGVVRKRVVCILWCRILLIVLSVIENDIEVVIHHGRKFVNEGCLKYEGETDTMYFDPDLWSYFVVVSVVKELGYDGFKVLWFSIGCGSVLDDRLEALCDDIGAMHMANLAKVNGQVHLYVVHIVSQHDVIHMIEYDVDEGREEVAPVMHDGGKGAVLDERTKEDDGGVTERFGQATKIHDVDGAEKIEANDVEGERIKVDEGHGERREADDVVGERIEVDDNHGEAKRREAHDGEGERLEVDDVEGDRLEVDDVEVDKIELNDGEANKIEVVELEDIKVQVCEWSTSDDDDNCEVNSMDGLVNINV